MSTKVKEHALYQFLEMAVPLEMDRLKTEDREELTQWCHASDLAVRLSHSGDIIQFPANGTGTATRDLIQALAALALVADGGVTFAGIHWCETGSCVLCPEPTP